MMGAMHWLLLYELVDDYLERRTALRPEHLGLAEAAHERGELLMAGALADPADRAVLVFTRRRRHRRRGLRPTPIPTCGRAWCAPGRSGPGRWSSAADRDAAVPSARRCGV